MNCEIIAIGSELLTPYRTDTNSLFLTERLNKIGVHVAFKTIVGDSLEHLTQAASQALSRTDIVIFTGGLGPTEDDLTREAVGEALSLKIRREGTLVAALATRAAQFRSPLPSNNLKQADVLDGAIVLPLPPSMTHRLFEASNTTPCGAPNTALLSSTNGFSS